MGKIQGWSRRQDLETDSFKYVWQNDNTDNFVGISNQKRPFIWHIMADEIYGEPPYTYITKSAGSWLTRAETTEGAREWSVEKMRANPDGLVKKRYQ